jgi:hypothetical protein
MSTGEMSWSRTAADSRIARGFCYLQIAFFGGMALIVGTAGVLLVATILRNGAYEVALLVFLLALVGGPFSLVYLWPILTDRDQRPPLPVFWDEYRHLPRRWIAVSSVLGGVGIAGTVALWPHGAGFLILGFLFVAYVCGGLFIGEGTFDPDAKTVVRNGQEIDLEAVSADRRYDVAGHSVLLLLFDRWATKTRLVLVPRRIADEIAATLGPDEDRGQETANHGDVSKSRPRAVTLTLTAFGLGALALSVGLVALARNVTDPGVLYWAALVGGFLGGLFIWLARRG